LGALLTHITSGADAKSFQPMNVNFGLFPPLTEKTRGKDRKKLMAHRALADLDMWLARPRAAAE
jgi:methylenetetrahydrofolate--tRNA-(uracil-5-)-methyltransferase